MTKMVGKGRFILPCIVVCIKSVWSQLPIPTVPPPSPPTTPNPPGPVFPPPISTAPPGSASTTTPGLIIVLPTTTALTSPSIPTTASTPFTSPPLPITTSTTFPLFPTPPQTLPTPPQTLPTPPQTLPTSPPTFPTATSAIPTLPPTFSTFPPTFPIPPPTFPATPPTFPTTPPTFPAPPTPIPSQTFPQGINTSTSILTPFPPVTPTLPTILTPSTPAQTFVPPVTSNVVCLPLGLCPPSMSSNGIDPRVTFPIVCPPGQEPCASPVAGGPQCGIRFTPGINNADGSSSRGAFPWQAFVTNRTGFIGSGVLIDQNHIITAAHKVYMSVNTPSEVRIALGVWDPSSQTDVQNRTAASIMVHRNFNVITLRNDIAVVRLNFPAFLGIQPTVGTICMPTLGQDFTGRQCMVAGWGVTEFTSSDAPTRPQKQVTVPIVTYTACRNSYLNPTVLGANTDTYLDPFGEICAGGEENRDACTFDGGAPLVCNDLATNRYTVAGLVIWGKGCKRRGVYGVYVNVPFYISWINEMISTLNRPTG